MLGERIPLRRVKTMRKTLSGKNMLNQSLRTGRSLFGFEYRDARRIASQSVVQPMVTFLVLQRGTLNHQQRAEELRAVDVQEQKMITKKT